MRIDIGTVASDLDRWLPDNEPDASGVGVNYAEAFLKALKTTLADGRKVSCRRRGLELTLEIGGRTGRALLRRIEHGPDVKAILHQALTEAAADAGAVYSVEDGRVFLELD